MTGEEPPKPACNYVHVDEIWKDHVRHEIKGQLHQWPQKWGFLIEEYKAMNDLLTTDGTAESCPETPTKKGKCTNQKPSTEPTETKGEERVFRLPPIHAKKPLPKDHRNSYPKTESRKIGWRSTRPQFQLDKYGQSSQCRGLGDLCKIFKWPREGL